MGRKLPQTRDSHAEQEVERGRGETAPWDGGGFSGCQTEKGRTGAQWVGPGSAKRTQNAEGPRGLPSGSPGSESSPASSSGNPLTPGCPLGELRLREGTERWWGARGLSVRSPKCVRSAHYPREDLELLPAERPDAAGMPRHGGVPTNLADAGAAWTLPPAPPSTDASLTCLPTPEGCRAAPFHHLYLKGHKQPSAPRRHDFSGSAPASLDSCRMEGGVHTPWRPWAWSSRRCPLETCAPTQCPLSPAPRPQVSP